MKNLLIILLLLFVSVSSYSQKWEKELQKKLIIVENGKLKSTDYTLITLNNGNSIKIKSYAEAINSGFISRDRFLQIFVGEVVGLTKLVIKKLDLEKYDYKQEDIDELTGSADFIFNFYFRKDELQIDVIAKGKTTSEIFTWDKVF